LWSLTLLASLSAGIALLLWRRWGSIALAQRRGTALAHLLVGFVNMLSLALYARLDPAGLSLPAAYGFGLMAIYALVDVLEDREKADSFPSSNPGRDAIESMMTSGLMPRSRSLLANRPVLTRMALRPASCAP
jgi:hypothetical protein